MTSETWTIGRLLTWTTDYLKKHGSEFPRLDAEVLLAHVRGCERIALYTAFDERASDMVKSALRELVQKRAAGTPVAYLVGKREFFSLAFRVSPFVLIPRPETEFLVLAAIDRAKERGGDAGLTIADLGTGSGAVAVAIARHLPGCRITAIDTSRAALDVAQVNAADHGVADRIEFVESDLFRSLAADAKFDIVVSNPPYVSATEFSSLPRDVRDHEPRGALVAGETGTEIIARLLCEAPPHMSPGGILLCEFSPPQKTAIERFVAENSAWTGLRFIRDLAGANRAFEVRRAKS